MSEAMTCAAARDRLALLLYGELSFDEEERLETHLEGCADCRKALERQRAIHDAADALQVSPSPALLSQSRRDLSAMLDREYAQRSWWRQIASGLKMNWLQPVGALALLAIGFFGGRTALGPFGDGFRAMSLGDFGGAQVRTVEPQADGTVRIILSETRQRAIIGPVEDQRIRALLVSAAKAAPDPGIRAETVTVLMGDADAQDVRDALVFALANDQNATVRLKAVDGLKRYAHDREVQEALAQVLLSDTDPSMRTQAIDLLTSGSLDRHTIGALQELMSREDDSYVRQRGQQALQAIRASAEIY
jgi:hypothetical protein